jgi:puromycin-sensitive aminopeptidase
MAPPPDQPVVAEFVRGLCGPLFAKLSWRSHAGESDRIGTLRAALLDTLGTIGADADVQATAIERHQAYLQDRSAVVADLLPAVINVVAWTGGEDEWELFRKRAADADTPQEEIRYLYALPRFRQPELLERTLGLTLSEMRTQNAPFVVAGALANRWAGAMAWDWLKDHWDEAIGRFPDNSISRMLEGLVMLTDPAVAADVRTFVTAHPIPQAQLQVDQILERLEINTAYRQREALGLGRAFRPS